MAIHTVVIPGIQNGPHTPLLMFSADAAELRGSQVTPIYWDPPREFRNDRSTVSQWIREQIEPVLDGLNAEEPPLLIAKSLGTLAAPIAAERGCPAIWLTPLLVDGSFVEAVRSATAPCLLVGGTADQAWNGELAKELSPHVLEVDGADHGMYLPRRPLADSAAVMGRVATAVEDFLDDVAWPDSTITWW